MLKNMQLICQICNYIIKYAEYVDNEICKICNSWCGHNSLVTSAWGWLGAIKYMTHAKYVN